MNPSSRFSSVNSWIQNKIKAQLHIMLLGLFFIIGMHYVEENNGGIALELPSNLISWIIISFILGLGFFKVATSCKFVYTQISKVFLLVIILLTIPTFFPDSNLVNESGVHLALLAGFFLFLTLQQYKPDEKELNLFLLFILFSAVIEALIGWKNYLGLSIWELSINGPGADVPYGNIRQRNVLSSLFVTGIVISAYLLKQNNKEEISGRIRKITQCVLCASPLLLIPMVIELRSRMGWISLLVSLLLVAPFIWNIRQKRIVIIWVVSVCMGFITVPALELANGSTGNAANVMVQKFSMNGPRNYMYGQVIDLALKKPFLGYGFGNFEKSYNLFGANGYKDGVYEYPAFENLSHPHNEFLFWWVEGGILGLIGLIIGAAFIIKKVFSCGSLDKVCLILAMFLPITLHSQTEIPFLNSVAHWVILIILVLMIDIKTSRYKEVSVRYYLLPFFMSFAIPAITSGFMVTTLLSGRLIHRFESDLNSDVIELENISNPIVWRDRLLWDMNFGLMALGYYQDRPELAENFIRWAPELISRKPRAGFYHYLSIAYLMVGDEAAAKEIQKEAEFRFPLREFNYDLSVFETIQSKNISAVRPAIIEE